MKHLKLIITGRVQGVGFRSETVEMAKSLGITGYVRNEEDGSVAVEAEGTNTDLEILRDWCKKGPEGSDVEKLEEKWSDEFKDYLDFKVRL